MAYGIKTFKADNTPILTPDSKSGVFARTFALTRANGVLQPSDGSYRADFPEYNGRTLRAFQLKSGDAYWSRFVTSEGLNYIVYGLRTAPTIYGTATFPELSTSFSSTVLYLFIK